MTSVRRAMGGIAVIAFLGGAASCMGRRDGATHVGDRPMTDQPGRFVESADASGLAAFVHTDGSSGRKFFPEQMGSGVGLIDYDNDGWLDIYFASGSPLPGYKGPPPSNRLFRNLRDGKFEDVTEKAGVACGKYSIGVAIADYDNDGWQDIYVCCFGPNVLYRNRGDGSFEDVTVRAKVGDPRLSSSAAWGDYNGDGFLDLYVANYVKYDLAKDRWCSKFPGKKSYCGPNLYPPEDDTLYKNNGDGTFTDVSVASGVRKHPGNGLGVVWLDFDEDGKWDVFIANDQSPNALLRNNGDGTFTDVGLDMNVAFGEQGNAQAGMGVDLGDYNNDGKVDIVVTNFSEETNALYKREGSYYRDVSYPSGMGPPTLMRLGFGTVFIDYDRDGLQDLFFANGHVLDDIEEYSDSVTWKQPNMLFRNLDGEKFAEVSKETTIGEGARVSRGATSGDLLNRGRVDIVVNALREKPLFYRNEVSNANHWLTLKLKAVWGNPMAIGAKVWVTAGGRTYRRDVRTAGSYASSLDPRPFFGLGSAAAVEEIKIRWPSGKEQKLTPAGVDRILEVTEPAS